MVTTRITLQRHLSQRLSLGDPVIWVLPAILGSVLFFYWPSFDWLRDEWSSVGGVFGHGYLIAAICVFLIFRALLSPGRGALAPSWIALPVLFGLSLVWLLGYAADVAAVQTLVLPAILLTAIWAALGRRALVAVSFAVLFLYFAMPAWTHVQFIFQFITTEIVHVLIRIIDIPVFVEGNFVHVPAGTFEIAGGCSGIGFILVGTSLSTLYGHLFYRQRMLQLKLVAVSLLIAMVINWIRVFTIILIGNAKGMSHPIVTDHLTLGWILFAIAMLPLFYLAQKMQPETQDAEKPQPPGMAAVTAFSFPKLVSATTSVVLVLAVAPVWGKSLRSEFAELPPVQIELPAAPPGWSGPGETRPEWYPRFRGPSTEAFGEYRADTGKVWVYANVYQAESQGQELIFFRNTVLGDMLEENRRVLKHDGDGSWPTRSVEIEADGAYRKWMIRYWYEIDGILTISGMETKLVQAISFILGRPTSGTIALATNCDRDCTSASRRLAEFTLASGDRLKLVEMVDAKGRK